MPEVERVGPGELETDFELDRVTFDQLSRGDRLIIETEAVGKPEETFDIFDIVILGQRKERTRVTGQRENCLLVGVRESMPKRPDRFEEYTARMPGGFKMYKGVTLGTLQKGEGNCLYLENLKRGEEKLGGERRTTPIKRIVLMRKKPQ